MSERKTISEYPIKPRRTRGTYTHKVRNRVAAGALAVCSLIGVAYHFLPSSRKIAEYAQKEFVITENLKVKKARLAPFSLEENLEASKSHPIIVEPQTPTSIKLSMAYADPGNVRPAQ